MWRSHRRTSWRARRCSTQRMASPSSSGWRTTSCRRAGSRRVRRCASSTRARRCWGPRRPWSTSRHPLPVGIEYTHKGKVYLWIDTHTINNGGRAFALPRDDVVLYFYAESNRNFFQFSITIIKSLLIYKNLPRSLCLLSLARCEVKLCFYLCWI